MTARSELILIIDRDEHARAELDKILVSKGFYVRGYAEASAALELFQDWLPDIIIADLRPGEIRDLVAHLEQEDRPIPLIAYREVSGAGDVVAALRAGAEDFILKPITDKTAIDVALTKLFDRVRISRLNQLYRKELEEANRDLRSGLSELRADQRAGRQVQMKMLPFHEKEINGLTLDHRIKPSLYLSGDFLDYFRLSDDLLLVYIADVSGHGASSAFVTVLLKNLTTRLQRNLRRGSSSEILYPDKFLQRVNAEILDSGLGKHVTIFCGIISQSTHRLSYAVGAHFPMPVLQNPGEDARYLEGNGLPVGLFATPEWSVFEVQLKPGFQLTLFSDGVLEVIEERTLENKEKRLLELVSGDRHTIDSLSSTLGLDEIDEFPDDVAILTISDFGPTTGSSEQ